MAIIENSLRMKLLYIPPGEFEMGSPESEAGRFMDENQHLRLTQGFYLGAHEVTVGQFREFVIQAKYETEAETDGRGGYGRNNATMSSEQKREYTWRNTGFTQSEDHPVVNVSWNDSKAFCDWLGTQEKRTYRLPTEAEWEYACRAGTQTAYVGGDDPETLAQFGNVSDGTAKAKFPDWSAITTRDGYVFTAPVGKFQPNAFGLYDLHGNVWEWCGDWYADYGGVEGDPPAPPRRSSRVVRGGGFSSPPVNLRCAYRAGVEPSQRRNYFGFRVACER